MKLGIFGINVTSAGAITRARDRHEIDWSQNVRLARAAEDAGFEAVVPFARWRGFEGESNPWGQSFEPYTWAAGIAASTSRIAVFSTSHILTVSPVMAAKQISTIDHISSGRAVLNVVAGWFQKELRMFGVGDLDHDERYRYAEEWTEILIRLWTEHEPFDYGGRHLRVAGGYQQPKSIQTPRPPIMNAAFSPVGHAFAARFADIAFVSPDGGSAKSAADKVSTLRRMAAEHGRNIQVWVGASVVCAASESAARREIERYSEIEGDPGALANCLDWTMGAVHMPPERRRTLEKQAAAFIGGYPLVGSASQICDQIGQLAEAGVDGLCLTWMNYEKGLPQFIAEILPSLERSGLRAARS